MVVMILPPFFRSPPEVHQLVFDCVEFIEDVVCLTLASRYFWTFARDHIHAYCISFLGRWAGDNIICVGEDVKPYDYPPVLFSAEERYVLRQKEKPMGRRRCSRIRAVQSTNHALLLRPSLPF